MSPEPSGFEDSDEFPFVSVIVPCYNEADHIRDCLDSVLQSEYPSSRMEVLAVDGGSDDGTRDILREYAHDHPHVLLLDNPDRVTPSALNRGLEEASGEVIVRIDAHSVCDSRYISNAVRALKRTGAENVGGVLETAATEESLIGAAIAAASSSVFGVGWSYFRVGSEEPRRTDTVAFGCFPRSVFERLGPFREELVRGQDYELNLRIRKAGGTVVVDPSLKVKYLVESSLADFARHRFRDGFWSVYPFRFGVRACGLRHLVPAAFLSLLALVTVLALWTGSAPWTVGALALLGAYGLAVTVASGKLAWERDRLVLAPAAVGALLTLHLSYAAGTWLGLGAVLLDAVTGQKRQ